MEEMMTNIENTEVQEPVVEAQTEAAEETPVVEEQSVEDRPVKKPQSREVNHQFKLMRQEQERLQKQYEQMTADNNRLMEALKGYGYSGNAEEVAAQIHAAQRGISYEEYQAQQEADSKRIKEMMQTDPEFLAMKQKADLYEQEAFNRVFKDDLAAIKKAFPDVRAKTVEDLGDQFTALRANGIDAVTAYAAINKGQEATRKPTPPVMGAINQAPVEKEFYTSEEVDNIEKNHPEMLDDPKIFNRIMKSMTKWGK